MKTKLILVEGIPGSGKSTMAQRIADFYADRGFTANVYREGGFHPADLAWNACIPVERLECVLAPYRSFREEIDQHTHREDDYAIISYTQVKTDHSAFFKDMEAHEVYDHRVPLDVFSALHRKRWSAFCEQAKQKQELTVFECAFLQNHVTELMYIHLIGDEAIKAHCQALLQTVAELSPFLIYLSQPSIRDTIERAAKQRGDWMEGFIHYAQNSPYGKLHGLTGWDAAIRCLEERKRIELEVIRCLPIRSVLLENPDYDWDALWETLEGQLPI